MKPLAQEEIIRQIEAAEGKLAMRESDARQHVAMAATCRENARELRKLIRHYEATLDALITEDEAWYAARGLASPPQIEGLKAWLISTFLTSPRGGHDAYQRIRAEHGNRILKGYVNLAWMNGFRQALEQFLDTPPARTAAVLSLVDAEKSRAKRPRLDS